MTLSESSTRSLTFLACLIGGLVLMIPAAWAGHALFSRVDLAPWIESVGGIALALLPLALLVRVAAKRLETQYPDSPAGRIPEPHERPSAHKRTS